MPHRIRIETPISAPPARVFNVLMDFEKYPEWNPFVIKISGEKEVGSKLNVLLKVGNRNPTPISPTVMVVDLYKELRWVGTLGAAFLFRGEHYYQIEETPTGCNFIHGEDFTGILEWLVTQIYGEDTKKAFESFNLALKQRAESP